MTSSNSDKNAQTLSNVASEKAVLSGLIQHGSECYVDVQSLLVEESFSVDQNKVIYKCLCKAFETSENIDLTSILSAASQLSLSDYINETNTLKHVNHLMNYNVHIDNVRPHAAKVRRLQLARDIQGELREIYLNLNKVDGDESITEIVAIPEAQIQSICQSYLTEDHSSTKLIGEGLDEFADELKSGDIKSPGISSGFPCYDVAIGGGFRPGCVDLIGARAKTGKSTLVDNITMNITSRGIPVLVLDTEMSDEDHWTRLLANFSDIPLDEINSGSFSSDPNKVKAFDKAREKIKSVPYHFISVAGKPFDEILGICRRWLLKHVGYNEEGKMRDCLLVYDYLKIMDTNSLNNVAEFQALGFQITQLHNFCVEYQVPCLSFAQLNRDGITKETEDAVSGSDRLIWLCTSFSIFKIRNEEEIQEESSIAKNINRRLIPVVSRHGPGLEGGSIYMRMTGDRSRLEEIGVKKDAERASKLLKTGFEETSDQDVSSKPDEGFVEPSGSQLF